MDYSGLQSLVNSSLGASDTPAGVYEIALAEINASVRIMDMEDETTLSVSSGSTAKPSGYLEAIDLYIDSGGYRNRLEPFTTGALSLRNSGTSRPMYYAETDGNFTWYPTPDGTYTVNLRYYAENSALSSGTDVNPVLTKYPNFYLYTVLKCAAMHFQDERLSAMYSASQAKERAELDKAEMRRKVSGPMTTRPYFDVSTRR